MLHADDYDSVERRVGLAVTAAVESVAGGHAGGGGDRCDAAEPSECRFGPDAFGVVAGDDQHLGGGVGSDGERPCEAGCCLGGEFLQ